MNTRFQRLLAVCLSLGAGLLVLNAYPKPKTKTTPSSKTKNAPAKPGKPSAAPSKESSNAAWETIKKVDALIEQGRLLHGKGEYARANAAYLEAISLAEQLNTPPALNDLYYVAAKSHTYLAQHQEALKLYQKALALERSYSKDLVTQSAILNGIGSAYHALSQHEKAIEYHQQALTMTRQTKDPGREADTLCSLGAVYRSMSKHAQAIEHYQQALVIERELNRYQNEGAILSTLGAIYFTLAQQEKAIEHYRQALIVLQQDWNRKTEAAALNGLMQVYHQQGKRPLAIVWGKQAINAFQRLSHVPLHRLFADPMSEKRFLSERTQVYRLLNELLTQEKRDREAQFVLNMLKRIETSAPNAFADKVMLNSKEEAALERYEELGRALNQSSETFNPDGTKKQGDRQKEIEEAKQAFMSFLLSLDKEF